MNHENKIPKFQFTQNTNGLHVIRDAAGNELAIDTTQLTMDDIRELLSGFGYIMQSISSHTWNKELVDINPEK